MPMSEVSLALDPELIAEISFIDLAHHLLKEAKQPFYYFDMLNELARVKGISEEAVREYMGTLYTDLNVDGRFTSVGQNLWGLKEWYPVDTTEQDLLAIEAFSPLDGEDEDLEIFAEMDEESFDSFDEDLDEDAEDVLEAEEVDEDFESLEESEDEDADEED